MKNGIDFSGNQSGLFFQPLLSMLCSMKAFHFPDAKDSAANNLFTP
jgi:hypothetical protein